MARPKLNSNLNGESNKMSDQSLVKHVVRGINRANAFGEDGSMPVSEIDVYLSQLVGEGYKLRYVYQIAQNETMIQMLYVLVKE